MRLSPRRVLICGAETGTAFAMVTALRRHWGRDLHIVTADSNAGSLVTASLLADRHHRTPPLGDPAFAGALAEILDTDAITDYVPLHDAEFAGAERLRPLCPAVAIWSSPDAARLAADKIVAQDWLAGLNLPVPRRYDMATLPQRGGVFAKPRQGFASRGAGWQPVEALRSKPPAIVSDLILQEVCTGPEVTVDSFHDATTGRGRAVMRERLVVRSGVSMAARLFEDDVLAAYARRIGNALGQRGTICFQVMRNDGGWVITDLNLRPGAGAAMSVAAGIDVLGAAAACRWDEPYDDMISAELPPAGVHVTRQYNEFTMP